MSDKPATETGTNTEQQTYENLNQFAGEAEFIPGGDAGSVRESDMPKMGKDELAFMFSTVFVVVASRRGEHWALNDEEASKLGDATDRVLEKYLPDVQTGPEASLLIAAGMIALPRILVDRAIQAEAQAKDVSGEGITDGD